MAVNIRKKEDDNDVYVLIENDLTDDDLTMLSQLTPKKRGTFIIIQGSSEKIIVLKDTMVCICFAEDLKIGARKLFALASLIKKMRTQKLFTLTGDGLRNLSPDIVKSIITKAFES